ncbi:MAG: hypothetical protein ACTS22_10410, partial [Phycisphaerales bacterium]
MSAPANRFPPAELLREGDPAFFEPSPYFVVLMVFGTVALASVILPRLLERRPLSRAPYLFRTSAPPVRPLY